MERQAITGTYVLHEHTFPCQADFPLRPLRFPLAQWAVRVSRPGGITAPAEQARLRDGFSTAIFFYRRPMIQDDPDFFHRPEVSSGQNEDFERAQQDRLGGGGGLVSIAYWIVRGVQLLFGALARVLKKRTQA
jgi:hypothetical protein